MVFLNNPSKLGYFAGHPPLQVLATACFAFGKCLRYSTLESVNNENSILFHSYITAAAHIAAPNESTWTCAAPADNLGPGRAFTCSRHRTYLRKQSYPREPTLYILARCLRASRLCMARHSGTAWGPECLGRRSSFRRGREGEDSMAVSSSERIRTFPFVPVDGRGWG